MALILSWLFPVFGGWVNGGADWEVIWEGGLLMDGEVTGVKWLHKQNRRDVCVCACVCVREGSPQPHT